MKDNATGVFRGGNNVWKVYKLVSLAYISQLQKRIFVISLTIVADLKALCQGGRPVLGQSHAEGHPGRPQGQQEVLQIDFPSPPARGRLLSLLKRRKKSSSPAQGICPTRHRQNSKWLQHRSTFVKFILRERDGGAAGGAEQRRRRQQRWRMRKRRNRFQYLAINSCLSFLAPDWPDTKCSYLAEHWGLILCLLFWISSSMTDIQQKIQISRQRNYRETSREPQHEQILIFKMALKDNLQMLKSHISMILLFPDQKF